jgi:hypothetical protein
MPKRMVPLRSRGSVGTGRCKVTVSGGDCRWDLARARGETAQAKRRAIKFIRWVRREPAVRWAREERCKFKTYVLYTRWIHISTVASSFKFQRRVLIADKVT